MDYRTKLGTDAKKVDTFFYKGTRIFEDLLIAVETMLHGYTHAGSVQINSRFEGYKEEDILATISGITTELLMVSRLVTDHFEYESEGEVVWRLHQEWMGPHSPST